MTDDEEGSRESVIQTKIDSLAQKYRAVVNWADGSYFTVQLQERLLGRDNRPIVFTGYFNDIEFHDGRYLIYFDSDDPPYLPVLFILESETKIIPPEGYWGLPFLEEYIVVAKINSVRRAIFDVEAESSGWDAEVVLNSYLTTVIAKGQLVDLLSHGSPVGGE